MKWTSTDIDMYVKAKEFIDTVVVPLIPITLKEDIKSICEMGEFITILSTELEREYKGRLIVLPAFTYLKEENTTGLIERLNSWNSSIKDENVKHVVYITADPGWKLSERELQATLLWFPSISINEYDKKFLEQMIKSQMKQMHTIVTNLWRIDDKPQ